MTLLFFTHRETEMYAIREFEASFLEKLRCRFAGEIWLLPHLYDLPDTCEEYDEIRAAGGPLIVFSWISAKAAAALLRQRTGLENVLGFDLRDLRDSTVTLDSLPFLTPHESNAAEIRRFEGSPKRRWYPIIDQAACQNCLECVNFCLFGVYTIQDDGMPLVEQPDQCRDGCPACSRVCPAGAILFPEYDDPVISGRTERTEEPKESNADDELDRLIDHVG